MHCSKYFTYINLFNLHHHPLREIYYYPHFTVKESEAWRLTDTAKVTLLISIRTKISGFRIHVHNHSIDFWCFLFIPLLTCLEKIYSREWNICVDGPPYIFPNRKV